MILLVLGALLSRSVLILLVLTQGAGNFHIHLLNIIVLTLISGHEFPGIGKELCLEFGFEAVLHILCELLLNLLDEVDDLIPGDGTRSIDFGLPL